MGIRDRVKQAVDAVRDYMETVWSGMYDYYLWFSRCFQEDEYWDIKDRPICKHCESDRVRRIGIDHYQCASCGFFGYTQDFEWISKRSLKKLMKDKV